jgi:hypothetical protein
MSERKDEGKRQKSSFLRYLQVDKAIVDKELYKSIVAHSERFSKLGGVYYATHFPPNLNPVPPAELMPEWERDYAEVIDGVDCEIKC